jgi:hypothetical protein
LKNSEICNYFSEKRKSICSNHPKGVGMPNHKQRKKKNGENKNKKMQAMRAKEALAKPASKPTATGKTPGQTSKFDSVKDRPGAFRRA